MSTPFFSTLTAFRLKKYTQFEPLIIHHKSLGIIPKAFFIMCLTIS